MSNKGKLIIGNWKLNGNKHLMREMLGELNKSQEDYAAKKITVSLCPPSIYVSELIRMAASSNARLVVGCQNISTYTQGSFTGELSAQMLKESGCSICLVGHSERRALFKETNKDCQIKIQLLLNEGITPVLCIGETLDENINGNTVTVLSQQLEQALTDIDTNLYPKIGIAYEPVYAIGSGTAISPAQVQQVHTEIRLMLAKMAGKNIAQKMSILYGGSVNKDNALNLISCEDVDGLLIGGASLDPQHFHAICNTAISL